MRVWPLVRMAIGEALLRGDHPPFVPVNERAGLARKWRDLLKGLTTLVARGAPGERAELLFYSGPRNLVIWNGRTHDRFADPLIIAATKLGHRSVVAEYRFGAASGFPRAIECPRYNITPSLWAASVLHARRPKPDPLTIPGLKGLLNDAAHEAPMPGLAALATKLHDLDLGRAYHGRILDRVRPTNVFLVCWYGVDHMGVAQACYDRGIGCVDLQHGVQGKGHLAYGTWAAVPPEGYGLMPSVFWCWDDPSADHIRSWSTGTPIRAFALGDPWSDQDPGRSAEGIWKNDGRTRVLYSAFLPDALPSAVREAIRATREQVQWMIRTHPVNPEMAEELETIIVKEGLSDTAFVSRTEELPLMAALHDCQLHVTRYSSVVMEAAAKGVPSVAIDPRAVDVFGPFIADGRLTIALTTEALIAQVRSPRPIGRNSVQLPPLEERLALVLQGDRSQRKR
ncbi:MAG: hypothetical protein QM724_12940 [Flavobacteriales bacterium]